MSSYQRVMSFRGVPPFVLWVALWVAPWVALSASCTTNEATDAGRPDVSTARDVVTEDRSTASCEGAEDCDDSIPCTIDACTVSRVCSHTPIDEMCVGTEVCQVGTGCTAGCATSDQCDNGVFCDGAETCEGSFCISGAPPDCNDGNECTTDTCDTGANGCTYAVTCDAGGADGGTMSEAFDPSRHYSGSFVTAPSQSLGCPPASYAISGVQFSVAGDQLIVMADWIRLAGALPTGPRFDVSFENAGCATYRLTGEFSDSDEFTGMFTATVTGGCAPCGNQSGNLSGVRR